MAGSFIQELKRRNVFRVAIIYIVVSWLLMQIGDVMFPALRLPDWTTTLLVAFLLLGLPVALIFAWAFELTPDGVVRTADVPEDQSITSVTGQKINYMIIGILAVAVGFLLVKDLLRTESPVQSSIVVADQSIAVLPFKNQSVSAENAEFFAGGLHDELLTLLSRLGGLRVISRTSVERLDASLGIPEIGALLGVATVLEGQVQRAGNRLRINVQLIDTAAEGHIWANTYDRELTAENVFEVQSDIARTIADALHAEMSPDAERLLAAVPTRSTQALEKYLLGVQVAKRQSFGALEDAIGHFEAATALDPSYAEAWTALADALTSAMQTGAISEEEYVKAAEPVVRRALDINPRLGGAHAQQASLQWVLDDFDGAESSFRQALELAPNDSIAVGQYAYFLRDQFRPDEAIVLLEKALPNDPLSTELLFQLGKAEMHAGRPLVALEYASRIREIDPSVVNGYTLALQANVWRSRLDEGLPWYTKAIEFDPVDYENWAHSGLNVELLGDSALADRYLRRAIELGAGKPAVLKCQVMVLELRGERDAAVKIAARALADGLDSRWGSDQIFLRTVRDAALDSGHTDDVLEYYRERAPRLFETEPVVTPGTLGYAVDAVLLLQHRSEHDAARRLLDRALAVYDEIEPNRTRGYITNIVDVEIFALGDDPDLALSRLREAVDAGWSLGWQHVVLGRNLDSVRDRPEYKQIVADLEAVTAEQRANWLASPHLGQYDLRDKPAR